MINSILFDQRGNLWLGTNNGLSRFDPRKGEFRNFDPSDGVQDEIFLPCSAFKSPDGLLYFGGVNGFNVFHPDSLVDDNPHPPKLLITDLKIFNKSVIPGKNSVLRQPISDTEALTLSYKHSTISFELLALGYSQPQKNQYAYMIEGVDPDWNYAGTGQTTASYTGLPRGEELLFKAKAANNDGVWNDTPTVLRIYIRPPFWETSWFRIVLLVFLLSSILGYYRWTVRNIKLRNLWLEREVKKQTAKVEIFLLFNHLSAHKKIIYNHFLTTLGQQAEVDFHVYNNDFRIFEQLLSTNLDDYSYYVIIPHFHSNYHCAKRS